MSRDVRIQDLLRFVVQIVRVDDDSVVGTGALVSTEGEIITCAHVVTAACASSASIGDHVRAILPANFGDGDPIRAEVTASSEDADIALLRLTEPPPIDVDDVAKIGRIGSAMEHRFVSFGYRALGDQLGAYANGRILGSVQAPSAAVPHPAVQLESSQISAGMSGAPILDRQRNLVVGIVSDTWLPDLSSKDRDTAWAVDLANLELLGFSNELLVDDVPKGTIEPPPQPADDDDLPAAVDEILEDRPGTFLRHAASPLATLHGRERLLADLREDVRDPDIAVSSLVGFGGQGKSSILRAWVDQTLLDADSSVSLFWWSFDANPDVEAFLQSLAKHYIRTGSLSTKQRAAVSSSVGRSAFAAAIVCTRPTLLLLDGLESVFESGKPGRLPRDLAHLVRTIAANDVGTHCVITSRIPVLDLVDIETHETHTVGPLGSQHAVALLRDHGLTGTSEELEHLAATLDNHALTLVLVASLIRGKYDGDLTAFESLDQVEPGIGDADLYARFDRLLTDYEQILTAEDRLILTILSLQRIPMPEPVFERVSQGNSRHNQPLYALTTLSRGQVQTKIDQLVSFGLVNRDVEAHTLACHALVKGHYAAAFATQNAKYRQGVLKPMILAYSRFIPAGTLAKIGGGAAIGVAAIATGRYQFLLQAASVAISAESSDDPHLAEAAGFAADLAATRKG